MKIRSLDELDNALDKDLSWRKHEISSITGEVFRAKKSVHIILMRAAIALMYAHWEGHIKKASQIYLAYLNHQAPKYSIMKENFSHISLYEKFGEGFSIKKYHSQKELFEYIISGLDCNFKVNFEKIINTESNLKSKVFLNLMHQLGLDTNWFETKDKFIDIKLVDNRNAIAHGDYINEEEIKSAYTDIKKNLLEMIQTFHNIIKNAAANKDFLKS